MLIKPIGLAAASACGAYVFIMPQLSTFVGLGGLLFVCMFITCFFFTGLARLAGIIGIINEISVQNQQTYNFAAMANGFIFLLFIFVFVFAISYMLRSSRPEKAVLHLLGRFFRSAEFLVSRAGRQGPGGRLRSWSGGRSRFYRHELHTLPAKLGAWGRAIDRQQFPAATHPNRFQGLLTSLQTLVYRTEALLDAGGDQQTESLVQAMGEDIQAWRTGNRSHL